MNFDFSFFYLSYNNRVGGVRQFIDNDPTQGTFLYRTNLGETVNKGIVKDFNTSYKLWQQYKNPFEPLVKKGYNAYLKANKQSKGVNSYNYVVDLFICYFDLIK